MNREDIIRMAREAGLDPDLWNYTNAFEHFAEIVASAEREECAKVCDDELKEWGIFDSDVGDVSKAIRARGQA